MRHEEDGESWKKGDIVSDGQSVSLKDAKMFTKKLNELVEIEIDLGLEKVKFDLDKEPKCTIEEMRLLMPLIEVGE